MTKEEISSLKIGDWIIWREDTYPHPRQIYEIKGNRWYTTIKQDKYGGYNKEGVYTKKAEGIEKWQLEIGHCQICREDELPIEFRQLYQIY